MSNLLPGEVFPRAPVLPVEHDNLPRPSGGKVSLKRGRIKVAPTPPSAEVVSHFSFPPPRNGESAEHGGACCRGYSRCGIARKGKRPIP